MQVTKSSGAGAMSGTINNTALSQVTTYEKPTARITDSSHGIAAGSELFFAAIAGTSYTLNNMRRIMAVATNTMDVKVPEGYTAGTPAGTEAWCAGFVNPVEDYLIVGITLHLSAAEAAGETLTLTVDAFAGAAWDVLLLSAPLIGVTDLIWFPEESVPLDAKDVLKFAWTNTGTKTWGLKIYTAAR